MERSIARRLVLLTLCGVILIPALGMAADTSNPLQEIGFEKYGSKWILPEEIALKRDLDALEEIARRTVPLRRQIELAVADNAQRWQKQQAASKLIDQIAKAMRRTAVGTEEEKKVQKQIDLLKQATRELRDGVAPDRLGAQPHMRAMLESLTLMHQQAAILSASVERRHGKIQKRYEQLPPKVTDWVTNQDDVAIGPLHRNEQVDQTIRKASNSLCLDSIPMFLQGTQKRVGVVLGDQFPAVVTLCGKDSRLVLTSNMAYSVGLRKLGSLEEVTLPGGHQTKARIGELPQLRLGSIALQNVQVVVLEPSDEHLGGFIGLKLLQAWNPQFAESGISLSLDASNHASTASR